MVKKENTSIVITKSGTKVYVVGNYQDKRLRDKTGDKFVDYFNTNFTVQEQRRIGNIYYDLYNKEHNTTQTPRAKMNKKEWVAQTGTFTGDDARELNPRHKKMVDVSFLPEARDDESAVTHEMIHAKKFMMGVKGRNHNERKIDFEMVGRISPKGIKEIHYGYYFSPEGNPYLAKKKGVTLKKKGELAKEGVKDDRRLLTGSVSKSLIGKLVEDKADHLFTKSFFFKRTI